MLTFQELDISNNISIKWIALEMSSAKYWPCCSDLVLNTPVTLCRIKYYYLYAVDSILVKL